jgi:protein-tyrosine phosphatase
MIPAIDDGPAGIEDVVEMLRKSYAAGTREMVATPHMFLDLFDNTDPETVRHAFEQTQQRLEEIAEFPESRFLKRMSFFLGAENFLSRGFLDALEKEAVLTINNGRYILIESPPQLSIVHMRSTLQKILSSKLLPIIAHPERYRAFQERPEQMSQLVEWGCLAQVNAGSLLGIYGRQAKKTSWSLLKLGLVHVIASDDHGSGAVKPHDLGAAYSALKGQFSTKELDRWLLTNAGLIVRGLPIDPP